MYNSGYMLTWIITNLHLVTMTTGGVLYPYGSSEGDTRTCPDDDMFTGPMEVPPFPFMGQTYTELYVNSNPILSLGRPFLEYTPTDFSLSFVMDDTSYSQLLENGEDCVMFANFSSANLSDAYYGLLAVFWADADPSANSPDGSIYYRLVTSNNTTLDRLKSDVTSSFPAVDSFAPSWAFILTYLDITYYDASPRAQTNTMQIVVASDGKQTFVFYNYLHVTWPNTRSAYADKALVGFASADSYCQVPQSMSKEILNLPSLTNVDIPGRWILRVDQPGFHQINCSIKKGPTVQEMTQVTTIESLLDTEETTTAENTEKGRVYNTTQYRMSVSYMTTTNSSSANTEYINTTTLITQVVSLQKEPATTQKWSYGFRLEFACAPFPSWFDIQTHAISVEYGDQISYWCKNGYEFSDMATKKSAFCSPLDKMWHPGFMKCQKILNAQDEDEYHKPVEAENAEFIGTVAVLFMFLEFLIMFLVDIPVWIAIFRHWFQCCHYYIRRLRKKKVLYQKQETASANDSCRQSIEVDAHSLNFI